MMDVLFSKIESKIKLGAVIVFFAGCLISLILAIFSFVAAGSAYSAAGEYVITGILYLIIGPAASYLCALLILGFVKIIENTNKMAGVKADDDVEPKAKPAAKSPKA